MEKQVVSLFGGSGTMGFTVLQELWKRRDQLKIVLLLRPSQKNIQLIQPFAQKAGLQDYHQQRIVDSPQLKIVWGDATVYADVKETIADTDWVLDAMAFISPQADYYPEQARAVNTGAIEKIVRAIEEEPNGSEHIRLIYTGTVAETGGRLPPIHWGRTGDPLKPSIYDFYAVTKIAGERAVLESTIKHWASLRLTFIMPTNYPAMAELSDPILFHQPLNSCMENVSDRDAGFGMANCLDIPDDSDFWRKIYNMGGGPGMRTTAEEYMNSSMQLLGLSGIQACTQRNWFALKNFHMQYYLDSEILNHYLHYWRDSMEDVMTALQNSLPFGLRIVRFLNQHFSFFRRMVEKQTRESMRQMAEEHRNGTAYWIHHNNQERITAFFGCRADYDAIQDWKKTDNHKQPLPPPQILDHGFDEKKDTLSLQDLQQAAAFRGGACLTEAWDGNLFTIVQWRCAREHSFSMKPNTVLHGGHWCPECAAPPWDYDTEARINPFFAQVWYANHSPEEKHFYPADLIRDIVETR